MSVLKVFADRLRGEEPLVSAWCTLPEPAIAAILARENFDAVILDLQHGSLDYADILAAIPLIAAAGKPTIARIPVGEYATASRLLDAGAACIVAPMINTIEEARRFAAFMKYPPMGERSWGPHGAVLHAGLSPVDYFRAANRLSIALAMVETRESLAIIDEILAEPGIDGIFIGPVDLAIALTRGEGLDPHGKEVEEALDHALARTRAAGKRIGIFAATGERARELVARGFDLVSVGTDAGLLRAGAQAALRIVREE